MTAVRVGVIGCGHWGPNHLRVFSQLRGSVVTAAADPDPRRRAALSSQYPHVEFFADHQDLLRHAAVDAVVVAVPAAMHYDVVRLALEAGKDVLCEKPLCTSVAEAESLVALAEREARVLLTAHVFLFNPGILKLKTLIDARHAGDLHYIRALRTNLGPVRADVNCVYDLASHDAAILMFLLGGAPLQVSAVGGAFVQPGVEDVAFLTMRFPDAVLAHVQVSWLDPRKLREIVVVGDRRMIVWDDLAATGPIHIFDKGIVREPYYEDYGQFQLLAREGDVTIPRVAPEEPLKVQNSQFLQAIAERRPAGVDGRLALDVLRTLEAATASMQAGGAPVPVPS